MSARRVWARCASCGLATYVCGKRGCPPRSAAMQRRIEQTIAANAPKVAAMQAARAAAHCSDRAVGCLVVDGSSLTCSCDCMPCHVAEFGPIGGAR